MSRRGSLSNLRHAPPAAKVQLVGRVAGIEACALLTDNDTIIVGASPTCDLMLLDPLAPARAFKLVHSKEHSGPHTDCGACWTLETYPRGRVFLNGELVHRARVTFGDTIATCCHELTFDRAEPRRRERRTNVAVDDLCQRLLNGEVMPRGFLMGRPGWRDWIRSRQAATVGAVLASIFICALLLLRPDLHQFENTLPPVNVVIMGNRNVLPAPKAVRSLKKVFRKSFAAPQFEAQPPELKEFNNESLPELDVEPVSMPAFASQPPKPLGVGKVVSDAGPQLSPLDIDVGTIEPGPIRREMARLGQTAPQRRVVLADASHAMPADLPGQFDAHAERGTFVGRGFSHYSQQVVQRRGPAPKLNFQQQRAANLAALHYSASPVEFEQYRGQRIPIARVPEQLPNLSADPGKGPVDIDGNVTDAEVAMSFKTGRFHVHGPGTAPEADPATYCYVGKTNKNGKDHLYISFVCTDPNLGALVVNEPGGTPGLAWDDSVEIFLDLNQDRGDYHHIIVNARGLYFASYCANADLGINGKGTPWDSGLQVKTTLDNAGSRWVCEIMVPYDHLPQVPAKGAEIPFNVCRNFRGQHSTNALQNWFAVYEGAMTNYHHPRLFGKLVWP